MKINFTKKEYRALLDIVHIADWVMHAHDTDDRDDTQEYRELIQQIFSHAKEMGFDDLIEHDQESDEYFQTFKFESESEAERFIHEYENNAFWGELISRLAERDVLVKKKVDDIFKLETEERFSLLSEAEGRWSKEFSTYDLDRLYVNPAVRATTH